MEEEEPVSVPEPVSEPVSVPVTEPVSVPVKCDSPIQRLKKKG